MTTIIRLCLGLILCWATTVKADNRQIVAQAIADLDTSTLQTVLPGDDAAVINNAYPRSALWLAIRRLARSLPAEKNKARSIVRLIIAKGARIDQPFESVPGGAIGMPATWVARIPGEQAFALALIGNAPVDKRCRMLVDMARDSNTGQWDRAIAGLTAVPPRERASATCRGIFAEAIRATDSKGLPDALDALFALGMMPMPADMPALLSALPANAAGIRMMERVLSNGDLDIVLPGAALNSDGDRPASLFAYLLHRSVLPLDGALQQNLAASPQWRRILAGHPRDDTACSAETASELGSAWGIAYPEAMMQKEEGGRGGQLRAATGWMINNCESGLLGNLDWSAVALQGSSDLVLKAMRHGIAFPNPDRVLTAAFCIEDPALAIGVMTGQTTRPDLQGFFACLKPVELRKPGNREGQILSWMLAHGADPGQLLNGARPLEIARQFGRDDIIQILGNAGATPVHVSDDATPRWLAHRLRKIAGFYPEVNVTTQGSDQNEAWRVDLEPQDLGADRNPEYIVWDNNCSAASCPFAVMHRQRNRWRTVLMDVGTVQVLTHRHNGWHDLLVSARMSAGEYRTTTYRFNGRGYEPARCEQTLLGDNGDEIIRAKSCVDAGEK